MKGMDMIEVKILGTGCVKCERLLKNTEEALKEMGIEYELRKIDRIEEIVSYGVMMTPALVVGDEVKLVGKVPSPGELKQYFER